MEKIKSESKFANGAIILSISAILCKFIGAFYRVPLSNILGAEGIGVYQLVFPIYSLFLVFASGGVPVALSKLVAECRARSEYKRAKRFLFQSIIILFSLSFLFSLFFGLFAKKIALFQGNENATLGYVGVSIAIVFASVLTGLRGFFQGYQNMLPTAISQIIEQVLKLVLGLSFASFLIEKGISFGVLGAFFGICLGEIFAFLYLLFTFFFKEKRKHEKEEQKIKTKFSSDLKELLKLSMPITLNAMILPLILAIDSFLVVNLLSSSGFSNTFATQMFGVYSGMVCSLVNFPTVISSALGVSLIPAIAFKKQQGKNENAGSIFKIIFYVAIPSILIYFVFSREIVAVLYPNTASSNLFNIASNLLRICAINVFYISLLQVSTSILQARGKSVQSLFNLTFAGVVKILLTYFFVISPLGIYGAGVASIMCYAIACGLNLIALREEIQINFKLKSLIFMFANSFIAIFVAFGLNYLFNNNFSTLISLIFSFFIAGIIYLILTLIFPIFSEKELDKIPYGNKINLIKSKFKRKKVK